jgi:hypothetical protein
MKLREEKGYTYGAFAGFEARRGEGPFVARAAVATPVTVPAVLDILAELERIRRGPIRPEEVAAARDYLVGVFPLRFETPGPIAAAVGGLHVHELPDEELTQYREKVEAVGLADVERAAREHIDLERLAVVLVGDASAFLDELEAAAIGPIEVEREPTPPPTEVPEAVTAEPGPVGEAATVEGDPAAGDERSEGAADGGGGGRSRAGD